MAPHVPAWWRVAERRWPPPSFVKIGERKVSYPVGGLEPTAVTARLI